MATNMMKAGSYTSFVVGTIPAGGTLSQEFDLATWSQVGMLITNFASGSLSFLASDKPDRLGSHYTLIRALDGSALSTGALAGTVALSGAALSFLAPFRYVKFLASTTQPNAPTISLIVKA